MDLNLLLALDALLRERNVTRAAEQLVISQPAMSASLARLRKRLGDPLLVREGRGYVLTPLAESLVVPLREAMAAAETVLGSRDTFDPSRDERCFTIVTSDYVALVLLSPLLAELADEAPNVRISVAAYGADNGDRLRRGSADLAIYPPAIAGGLGDLPHRVLFEDEFVVAVDRDHPDVGDHIDLELFSALPSLAARDLVSLLGETEIDSHEIFRRTEVTTETFVVVPLMVIGTRMIAVVQERLARAVASVARLRLLPSPVPLRSLVEAMYWNPRHTEDPAHRWLRERVLDQARRL